MTTPHSSCVSLGRYCVRDLSFRSGQCISPFFSRTRGGEQMRPKNININNVITNYIFLMFLPVYIGCDEPGRDVAPCGLPAPSLYTPRRRKGPPYGIDLEGRQLVVIYCETQKNTTLNTLVSTTTPSASRQALEALWLCPHTSATTNADMEGPRSSPETFLHILPKWITRMYRPQGVHFSLHPRS